MKILYKLIILFIFMLFISDCIQPYEPEIGKYENVLVVDGLVSNLPGPYEVKLSRSYPYNADTSERVSGATVRVIDDSGNEYLFTESSRGVYKSDSAGFQGQVGKAYKLVITTSDGTEYESDYEPLNKTIDIDSVYYKYEPKAQTDVQGIQIYLDTHDPENSTHYYGWTLDETWEIRVPYYTARVPDVTRCYPNHIPKQIFVGSTIDNIRDELQQYPLFYVSNQTNRLRYKYSLMVKQYTLSEMAYLYYKNLAGMNETSGTLFDAAPYSLTGNIKNIHNDEEPVLGIFQVSSVSSKRIIIEKGELPPEFFAPSGYEYCEMLSVEVTDSIDDPYLQFRVDSVINYENVVIMDTAFIGVSFQIRLVSSESCFDCTTAGTNIQPDYW